MLLGMKEHPHLHQPKHKKKPTVREPVPQPACRALLQVPAASPGCRGPDLPETPELESCPAPESQRGPALCSGRGWSRVWPLEWGVVNGFSHTLHQVGGGGRVGKSSRLFLCNFKVCMPVDLPLSMSVSVLGEFR